VEPIIFLNALTRFSAPQTLKLIGYIKHRKVIILVDSGNTHNFIHRRIAQETHCYIHAVNNFQIMIANGGSMKCGGRCENVRLQIGDCHLKSHMFAIDMGGCDIVLGADWLRTLGPILMDFQNLTMQFDQGGHQYKFQGITVGSPKVISSHRMEKLLKKGHSGVIAQLHAIQAQRPHQCPKTSKPSFLNIKRYFRLPKDSLLPAVSMIIPFPLSQAAFTPIYVHIATPLHKKMKLKKWSRSSLLPASSVLVRALNPLRSSWY
jgi:hypothetical protein